MKKIFFISLLACITLLLHPGCRKDEVNLPGEKSIKSVNACDCIDPSDPIYCEMVQQKIVTWGSPKNPFTKTVDIIFYNTLTHFIVKVKSSSGWSDLLINNISVWTQGPVAANVWGEYSVELPSAWEANDDYNFVLEVTGNGPASSFDVEYALVGECETNGTVKDIDNNTYQTVIIGTQIWMAENLKTTRLNDGAPIYHYSDNSDWTYALIPAYCYYDNNLANRDVYGALYNWYAVETEKLCPVGFHVPTHADWITLREYLGGEGVAGGELKETGTAHWISPNAGATNSTGFTALPGGARYGGSGYWGPEGNFGGIGARGGWWSSTPYEPTLHAWNFYMLYDFPHLTQSLDWRNYGLSVRCVKDIEP